MRGRCWQGRGRWCCCSVFRRSFKHRFTQTVRASRNVVNETTQLLSVPLIIRKKHHDDIEKKKTTIQNKKPLNKPRQSYHSSLMTQVVVQDLMVVGAEWWPESSWLMALSEVLAVEVHRQRSRGVCCLLSAAATRATGVLVLATMSEALGTDRVQQI